ncbi:hypothetical protein HAX54_027504 [Datura stramonium]|uniref:Uncharacterized protein n=1 Tax=Datura stramonium TaxID=4076 RepID=A0ABS8V4J1_DATST|nr:hypothetical protein [Datura stramonium]
MSDGYGDVVASGGHWKRSLPEMETGEGRERGVAALSVVVHGNGSDVFVLFPVTAGDKADDEGEGRSGVRPKKVGEEKDGCAALWRGKKRRGRRCFGGIRRKQRGGSESFF